MINDLLDKLQMTARVYGSTLNGPIPSPEAAEWQDKRVAARAAVDAKVKELQDRIAELEKAKLDFVKFRGLIVVCHPEFPPHVWDGNQMKRVKFTAMSKATPIYEIK